ARDCSRASSRIHGTVTGTGPCRHEGAAAGAGPLLTISAIRRDVPGICRADVDIFDLALRAVDGDQLCVPLAAGDLDLDRLTRLQHVVRAEDIIAPVGLVDMREID